jgi:hypothetical protein
MGYGFMGGAFWLFLAAVVVAGIWSDIREKEAKERTTQKLIEHGKDMKPEDLEKLIGLSEKDDQDLARGLKVAGLITLFVAPGLSILGWAVGKFQILSGVGVLVLCVSIGLLVAGKYVEKSQQDSSKY